MCTVQCWDTEKCYSSTYVHVYQSDEINDSLHMMMLFLCIFYMHKVQYRFNRSFKDFPYSYGVHTSWMIFKYDGWKERFKDFMQMVHAWSYLEIVSRFRFLQKWHIRHDDHEEYKWFKIFFLRLSENKWIAVHSKPTKPSHSPPRYL